MTDRELLGLAAKAAGAYDYACVQSGWEGFICLQVLWDEDGYYEDWNPLTDDGDALRLAVKLELKISHRTVDVDVSRGNASASVYVPTYSGREEATRRAIVRAAAEIGREMP